LLDYPIRQWLDGNGGGATYANIFPGVDWRRNASGIWFGGTPTTTGVTTHVKYKNLQSTTLQGNMLVFRVQNPNSIVTSGTIPNIAATVGLWGQVTNFRPWNYFVGEQTNRIQLLNADNDQPLPEWIQFYRHNLTLRYNAPYKISKSPLNIKVRMYAADDTYKDQTFQFTATNQVIDTQDLIEDECHFVSSNPTAPMTELSWQFQNGFTDAD
jgi:hypothetical protein